MIQAQSAIGPDIDRLYTGRMSTRQRSRWTLTALFGLLGKCLIPGCAAETVTTGTPHDAWFDDVRWEHRLLVITGPEDRVADQAAACHAVRGGMLDRELIVVDASTEEVRLIAGAREDLPAAGSFRTRFDLPTDTFEVVLVGKDGGVKERRTERFETEELFQIIDAMPMRMREMRERNEP